MSGTLDRIGLASAALAWLSVGAAALAVGVTDDPVRLVTWWVAYAAFGIVYGITHLVEARHPNGLRVMVALQVALAVLIASLGAFLGLGGVLLVLSAVTVSVAFPAGAAVAILVGQTLAATVLAWLVAEERPVGVYLVTFVAFLAFELFAFLMVRALVDAEHARVEIADAHAALQAAQDRLAESSRTEERLRIARDLHDAIGHQLTALAVNLEVASRTVTGPGAEQVAISRQMAKDLLGEVREVVGRLREPVGSIAEAVAALAGSVSRPTVEVTVDADIVVTDPGRREAIVRCVQEAVTNAARHAQAEHLWVSVEQLDGSVTVTARDDGRGAQNLVAGNGLTGMAERFAALDGTVTWFSRPGRGFTLEASVPVRS